MAFYLGYIVWEFPTVYIAQKLPLVKYLSMSRSTLSKSICWSMPGANIIVWGVMAPPTPLAPSSPSDSYWVTTLVSLSLPLPHRTARNV
ncbi:hypothetical protein BS17DRAFT_483513 [Gyrodon lividus]|nr:hypothetical protein BS17DRAFT_483513 [Gyrodon lividus]